MTSYTEIRGRFSLEPIPVEQVPLTTADFKNYMLAIGEVIDNTEAEFRLKICELRKVVRETSKLWFELRNEMP